MPPKCNAFTKNIEIIIAKEVEKRPVLWDATADVYKRADLKPMAWEAIASLVGLPFTAETVAKRFKNMKETFAKNLAKVKASKRSGCGTEDVFTPTWYLYNHLLYLQKACAQADSTDNLGATQNQELLSAEYNEETDRWTITPAYGITDGLGQDAMDHETEDSSFLDDVLPMLPEPLLQIPPRPSSVPICSNKKSTIESRASTSSEVFFNKRGATKKTTATVMESAVRVMEKIANAPLPSLPVEEKPAEKPCDVFCAMIAGRLTTLSPEARKECENEILKVLLNF